jgi:hypothetical protein
MHQFNKTDHQTCAVAFYITIKQCGAFKPLKFYCRNRTNVYPLSRGKGIATQILAQFTGNVTFKHNFTSCIMKLDKGIPEA